MKINKQKFITSFCIILLCLSTLPLGEACADTTDNLFSRFMSTALEASTINMKAIGMGIADGTRRINDFLAKPFRVVANDFYYVDYTTPIDSIDEYFNRSKLTIRPNAILIDDVQYTNIWLSKDASEQFRINSFDIVTAWNIASQSNGTFVSGEGYVFGVPVFDVNDPNWFYSQTYHIPVTFPSIIATYNIGDVSFNIFPRDATRFRQSVLYPDNYSSTQNYAGNEITFYTYVDKNNWSRGYGRFNGFDASTFNHSTTDSQYFYRDEFEFDWVSADIPADVELPDDYGLKVQIPTSYISNWLIDYGDTYIDQELTINTTDTDLMIAIDNLMEIVNNYSYSTNTDIYIKYGTDTDPEPPTPTPTPTPPPEPTPPMPTPTPATGTDIIADTPWAFLEAWLQNIRDILRAIYDYVKQIVEYYLENIHADLFLIEQKLDEVIEKLEEVGEDISNKLSLIFADIGDITVDIGSFLDDFIIDLEQAPIKLADKSLDILKIVFLPVLTRLRNALGIWHYVTEWISSISGPFSYFINILYSAFPAAITPIYACVAGTLCILVYKRFGR